MKNYIDNLFAGLQLSSTPITQDIKENRSQLSSQAPCNSAETPTPDLSVQFSFPATVFMGQVTWSG